MLAYTFKQRLIPLILVLSLFGFIAGNSAPASAASISIHFNGNHAHHKNYHKRHHKKHLSEKKAKSVLKKIEKKNPGSHMVSRHGASTSLSQQRLRATTGITPDGKIGAPMSGARWLSNVDQLHYYNKAKKIHYRTGQHIIDLKSDHYIGEGFLRGGNKYVKTKWCRFIFNNGKIVTSYPLLR